MKLDRLALLNGVDRSQKHPFIEPRQAASLLVIDRQSSPYKILMGRRTSAAVFMPDVYVYPGGAVDRLDIELARLLADEANMAVSNQLLSHCYKFASGPLTETGRLYDNLLEPLLGPSLALCALRELYEETGLKLGLSQEEREITLPALNSTGIAHPYHGDRMIGGLIEGLKFFARAITPPGRKMRFDTKFFAMDYAGEEIRSGDADGELSHMQWVSYEQACDLKLHPMTRVILEDLHEHVIGDGELSQPGEVAFYHYIKDSFYHEVIDFHSSS